MATKTTGGDEGDTTTTEQQGDGPLLDLSDAAVKRMIKLAKKRGYVTYDELNEVLPPEEFNSEQIEDVLGQLSEMGINVVESEEAEEGEKAETAEEEEAEGGELVEASETRAVAVRETTAKEPTDRTDDPVRMYLREMGSVELLSREGEIAIAKRIEAGREAMIAGLCESPLTFQAIIIWRDELNAANVLLRDIIDLEATYAGPDAKAPEAAVVPGVIQPAEPAPPPPQAEARSERSDDEEVPPPLPPDGDLDDDEDFENNLSLAAMEAEIKPKVLETFDRIADNYKKLRKLQDALVSEALQSRSLSPAQEKRYKKLTDEIIV